MGQKQNSKLRRAQNHPREQPDAKPKLKRKEYEEQIAKFHTELVKLQFWVKQTGARIIVLFEGRDAAGKGGSSNESLSESALGYFGWLLFRLRPNGSDHKSIFNAISSIFRPRAKSSSLTVVGTIVPALSE
jgi:hypothetical protein